VPDPLRDDVELSLVMAALDRDLPVLAVCRGLQLLNVARGGSLRQHLPDVLGTKLHRQRLNTMEGCWHEAVAVPGTRLAEVVGTDPLPVVSHHHQGVGRVGDGLAVCARAADGVVEGLEDPDHRFALAVQWHPEMDPADRLIPALARAAAAPARVRRPTARRLAS
jgi:gamma-glutamyl-gamma-aminobutyrate hydrolase PuuD